MLQFIEHGDANQNQETAQHEEEETLSEPLVVWRPFKPPELPVR